MLSFFKSLLSPKNPEYTPWEGRIVGCKYLVDISRGEDTSKHLQIIDTATKNHIPIPADDTCFECLLAVHYMYQDKEYTAHWSLKNSDATVIFPTHFTIESPLSLLINTNKPTDHRLDIVCDQEPLDSSFFFSPRY